MEHQQVPDDRPKPQRHEIAAVVRLPRDERARDDLDHADREHERVRRDRQQAGDRRRQVLVPVHEEPEELVDTRDDGREHERDLQDAERLTRDVGADRHLGARHAAIDVMRHRHDARTSLGQCPASGVPTAPGARAAVVRTTTAARDARVGRYLGCAVVRR